MVSSGLWRPRPGGAYTLRAAAHTAALIALAACGGGRETPATDGDTTAAARFAAGVRERYTARDLVVAGAWTWTAPNGLVFVLADVQSTLEGLVQARLDLWVATDTTLDPVGRSDAMSAAAEFGAYTFDDLTGDQLPDFFGYIADSAGTTYPVFLPGAVGAMADELEAAAAGWRFATLDSLPSAIWRASGSACALRLWAEAPTPDGREPGWRYLRLDAAGRPGRPGAVAPDCGPG